MQQVVDFLNYKLGITHNDMAPRNLFIDPSTDDLILFDFNYSERTGYMDGRGGCMIMRSMKERNDVKGAVMTVHELLTRDPRYEGGAQLHKLDEADLLAGPEKWVKHPEVQLEPGVDVIDYYNELMRWVKAHVERPIPMYNLDRSRRLLATGRYADDPSSTGGPGWESENPVTEARLKDDKTGQEQQVPAPVPVPVAITSAANPDPKPSDATAEPETGSNTTGSNTPDNLTPDNTTTTTTTTTNTTPTNPPPSTPPLPQPDTARSTALPTIIAQTNGATETNTETKAETKTENKVENKPEPKQQAMPLKAARATRKRAASAALRDDGRPTARRSPRLRARSLSRGAGGGGGVGK